MELPTVQTCKEEEIPDFHVVVKFGKGISNEVQSKCMMTFERILRDTSKLPVEVFKETMEDDSKLRRSMTPEQRKKL